MLPFFSGHGVYEEKDHGNNDMASSSVEWRETLTVKGTCEANHNI